MKLGEKIKQLSENKGFTPSDLASKLRKSTTAIYDIFKKEHLNTDIIKSLSELFGVPETYFFEESMGIVNSKAAKFRKAYKVPVKAYAGYLDDGFENIQVKELEEIYILDQNYTGEIRCFEVEGDSMSPILEWNDTVICKRIEELQDLKKGKMYLFVTDNCIVVKFLGGIGASILLLKSANTEYKDLHIDSVSVKEIWQVLASIRNHI